MKYRLLSVVLIIQLVSRGIEAVQCPEGYAKSLDDLCYKTYNEAVNRADAVKQCKNDGSILVDISNAFKNVELMTNAETIGKNLWLGLTCTLNNKADCTWDRGKQMTSFEYDNFYPQNPNTVFGSCVYMSITSGIAGYWFSTDCESTMAGFTCQYIASDISCPPGYTLFGENCYGINSAIGSIEQAERDCQYYCAHVASILSDAENDFIRKLAQKSRPNEYFMRVGLIYNSSHPYEWLDGSQFIPDQYSNFGYVDPYLGYCFGMALTDYLVPTGTWISTQCDDMIYAVCKRPTGDCVSPTNPPLTDAVCTHPYFLNGNGTIYSPGYPKTYVDNVCEYIIGEPEGCYVVVDILENNMDPSAYIKIYNGITPRSGYSDTIYPPPKNNTRKTYRMQSTITLKFFGNESSLTGNHNWKIAFYPFCMPYSPVTCPWCQCGNLTTPGVISSPYYPRNFFGRETCSNTIVAPSNQRVFITFAEVLTPSQNANVTIYDGPRTWSPVIQCLFGNVSQPTSFTSTTNTMLIVFRSDGVKPDDGWDYRGFIAKYSAV